MANEWLECRLADACSAIDYGLTASAVEAEIGPRFLRITDIVSGHINWKMVPHVGADDETLVKYQVHDGDIVLARTGASTGASAYIKNPPLAVFASYLVRLKVKPEFDARYLAYYLKSESFWSYIRSVLGDKSAQPNASASTMTQAPLRAPRAKDEQRAIGAILAAFDEKIELNRRMNETLEAIARAIFKSWFVDFDPVCAKAEGRQPSGMDADTAALFPDSFEDSLLGKIPRGWRIIPIGECVRVFGGSTPRTEEPSYWQGGFHHFVTPKDLSQISGPILIGTERLITDKGLRQIGSGLLPPGTVLLSSRAPIGYTAIADIEVAVNQGIAAMVCDGPVPNCYAYFWTKENLDTIVSHANGSTFLEINKGNFRKIDALRPDDKALEAFSSIVAPIFGQIANATRESKTLAAIRDALLPKLMSGEVTVAV